jgi:hypothetical protein
MQVYRCCWPSCSHLGQKAHKVRSFVYGKRSEIDLHVDYVSHQLFRNVFQDPSRVGCFI